MLLSDGVMRPVTVLSYVAQLGQFKLETRTALKKTELLFKTGEEFVEITGDGRRTTSKVGIAGDIRGMSLQVTVEGNTMVHEQKGDPTRQEKNTKIVRTFESDTMHCVCTITSGGGSDMRYLSKGYIKKLSFFVGVSASSKGSKTITKKPERCPKSYVEHNNNKLHVFGCDSLANLT
jgi:hypothetical protein